MRIFTDGAESGDMLIWSSPGSGSNVTTAPRSGSRHYRFSSTTVSKNITSVSEFYARWPIRFTNIGFSHKFFYWRSSSTELGSIRVDNTLNVLEIYTGSGAGTLRATGTSSISANTWYSIEIHVKIADSSGGGMIEVLIDGSPEIAFYGDTKPGAETTVNNILSTVSAGDLYLDDIALNDTSGVNDNSWCGDGKVVMLLPNAAGDNTGLTRGGTDSGANWSQVDEVPSNGDTDYVYSTGGAYDLYNLSSGSAVVPADANITRVWVETRTRETSATGDFFELGVKTNSTENWSADITATTAYNRYVGDDMFVNPITGNPWTISELDNLQAGVKVI